MQPGLEQILEADQLIWRLLSKVARGGIKRRNAATRPLDDLLPGVLQSFEVQMALMPRQGSARSQQPAVKADPSNKLLSALQKQVDDLKRAGTVRDVFGGPAKGGAAPAPKQIKDKDGKGKKRKSPPPAREPNLPKELAGCQTRSSAATGRKRMCFNFNKGSCKDAKPGYACNKGAHICMKDVGGEACSGDHPAISCSR
jgi:hypothetical protein